MSTDDWGPITEVIGKVLGGAIAAPLVSILGPLAPVFGNVVAGRAVGDGGGVGETPPTRGPGSAPAPLPAPLPAPPGGPAPGTGAASEADSADAGSVAAVIAQLHELDQSAAATIDAIQAAGLAGQQQLDNISHDVNDKITELGPRLDTPAGQQELRDFLKERLTAAKKVIDQQIADADAKARHTRELADKYGGIGGGSADAGGSEPAGNADGGGASGTASAADQGTAPAAAPVAAAPGAGNSPFGPGMMSPGGMMPAGMGMPAMPSFGGGLPGLGGGGDPLSALSGLGGGQGGFQDGGREAGFHDDQSGADPSKSGTGDQKFHDDGGSTDPQSAKSATAATQPAGQSDAAAGGSADSHPDGKSEGAHPATDPGASAPPATTHVALPNGESVEARTVQGATAVKAAMSGAPVADAWHQAGVNVPPPGTPVTNPIPPTKLQAGDVGVWQDHLVMALGNGKVLVSGQVQPLSSVGTSPDFLGWMDPSAQSPAVPQPSPTTPTPPPSAPPSGAS